MTAPFAAHEARINAAVARHLANATADFGGGVTVDGEFSNVTRDALGQIIGEQPTFRCVDSIAADYGAAVSIAATSYTVAERRVEDGGMVLLLLQAA